jgi:hypothetical protein
VALTGNGESGFGSGEEAGEMATTSKEDSRRVTYPLPVQGGSDNKYLTEVSLSEISQTE